MVISPRNKWKVIGPYFPNPRGLMGMVYLTTWKVDLYGKLVGKLVGGFKFQPNWKICSSNWIISPNKDENKQYLSCHHLLVALVIIPPRKLTWNLKMKPWKRRFLLKTIIFRFHVGFRGSNPTFLRNGYLFGRSQVSVNCMMCKDAFTASFTTSEGSWKMMRDRDLDDGLKPAPFGCIKAM